MNTSEINNYSIAEALDALAAGIKSYLMKDPKTGLYITEAFYRNPFYLVGPPGIGKTKGVEEVARRIGIGFLSFSLTHHTRNTILGLPVICDRGDDEEGGKYTNFTMSEIIAKVYDQVNAGYKEGILLLDEFPCMSDTIMPAMLAFLQTKNIGMHTLPDGWIIVLSGNPHEYNNHSREFDAAVTDRLRTLNISWDENTFIRYAKEKGFHERIINFIELCPDNTYLIDDSSLVTCRGWENLSNELKKYEILGEQIDYRLIRQFIKSDKIATSFFEYYIENLDINRSEVKDIIEGRADSAIVKKYSDSDATTRLNLIQLLQRELIDETAVPYRKLSSLDQLKTMLSQVKGKEIIHGGAQNKVYMTPLEVLNHIISNNGDCSGLYIDNSTSNPTVRGVPQFGLPYGGFLPHGLSLDIPDIWGDRELVKELRALLHEMCDEEERKPLNINNPQDAKRISDRQVDRINKFIKVKSGELRKSWNTITKHIDNVFVFLDRIKGGKIYTERFFYFIGNNKVLLRSVAEGNSKEYYKRLDGIYGGTCA